MGVLGILKALGAAAMAVAIFYVGGMASLEALSHVGEYDWAIKTATFWTGSVLMTLVLVEATRRVIAAIGAFLDDDAGEPRVARAEPEEKDDPPPKPAVRPAPPARAAPIPPAKKA